ncbi:MAG: hypothetical protein EZS28_036580, partial [Streblomastix strix]
QVEFVVKVNGFIVVVDDGKVEIDEEDNGLEVENAVVGFPNEKDDDEKDEGVGTVIFVSDSFGQIETFPTSDGIYGYENRFVEAGVENI